MTKMRDEQERFIHLVRLAWDLHATGPGTVVDLPVKENLAVLVRRAKEPFRIGAVKDPTGWFFAWGRRRDQRVRALDINAFQRVLEAAQ
ncbi:hypothetical protein [Streptosporangium sp. NPDC051022]|uniref:hypothetical protein n=1 Tax=Streptosporangium sp. NPDC051022 TaxID=3155752 RepID=UPI00343F9A3C